MDIMVFPRGLILSRRSRRDAGSKHGRAVGSPPFRRLAIVTLKTAFISNGTIDYINGKDAVPTTSEVQGNTTYNTIGTPAVPASFDVGFRIYSTFEIDSRETEPFISISVPVAIESKKAQFREIEDKAAASLAPMLRAIADAIDKQIADFLSERGEADTEATK